MRRPPELLKHDGILTNWRTYPAGSIERAKSLGLEVLATSTNVEAIQALWQSKLDIIAKERAWEPLGLKSCDDFVQAVTGQTTKEEEAPAADPASADPPPRVIHWRDRERHDRVSYVGRAAPRQGLAASAFGNPYRVDVDGTRAEVIERYREWILTRPELLSRLHELRGRVLACWCKPEACRGDVLAELVDADETIETLLAAGVRPETAGDRLRLHPADSGGIVPPGLVERARRDKAGILSLLAARRPPVPLDASAVWLDALDRLKAEIDVPPDVLAECKAARVKFA